MENDNFDVGVLIKRRIKELINQTENGKTKKTDKKVPAGAGDKGYTIDAEFVDPKYFQKKGALAAARTGDQVNPERKSSGSQSYIVPGRVGNPQQLTQMETRIVDTETHRMFPSL